MKYWVFNEEQLQKALQVWRASPEFGGSGDPDSAHCVEAFLFSDAARAQGMRGDKEA